MDFANSAHGIGPHRMIPTLAWARACAPDVTLFGRTRSRLFESHLGQGIAEWIGLPVRESRIVADALRTDPPQHLAFETQTATTPVTPWPLVFTPGGRRRWAVNV